MAILDNPERTRSVGTQAVAYLALGINGEPEHDTDSIFCWCAPRADKQTDGSYIVIHKSISDIAFGKENKMFHWQDGWFFQRINDGTVRIEKWAFSGDEKTCMLVAEIPAHHWASIVAGVSQFGDHNPFYAMALAFHGEPLASKPIVAVDVTETPKDK